jgi:hypothetical protein
VSAQAKPISELVKDFEQSLRSYRPSTRRVYVAGARAAIRAASFELWQSPSTNELLASIAESPTPQRARISPFLTFLAGPNSEPSASDQAALRTAVIDRIAQQVRLEKNPSIASRRDTALLAALCAAPQKGTPRKWSLSCLTITGTQVLLWQTPIKEPCLALALRFWHSWRERLSRPDQCRLYRKSAFLEQIPPALSWATRRSPGPERPCTTLSRRLKVADQSKASQLITPEKIRFAFLFRS